MGPYSDIRGGKRSRFHTVRFLFCTLSGAIGGEGESLTVAQSREGGLSSSGMLSCEGVGERVFLGRTDEFSEEVFDRLDVELPECVPLCYR